MTECLVSDPNKGALKTADLYSRDAHLARRAPTPAEIFLVPPVMVACLMEILPKIQATGAWWAISGDIGENLLDVHVRPTEVEILTNEEGLPKIIEALSYAKPTPTEQVETKLDREAEIEGKNYPVFVRSKSTRFELKNAKVVVYAEFQMKVGEWEWGDSLFFEPVMVNLAGKQLPVTPLRIKTELYLILGWGDRAELISEATSRAHAFLHMLGEDS
jgi:hypothetical protein